MPLIDSKKLKEIEERYGEGYSAQEIADVLNVSLNAVYNFFKKHNIPRRTSTESNRLRFQRKEPSFQVKQRLSYKEEALKTAGIMLYWGEGSKWAGEKIVDFANSDPVMIKIFMAFLREICGIDESKLRAYLYCYENQNPTSLKKYWSKIIKISERQFTKPYIRRDFQQHKIGKMKHGLLHIRYYDKKLLLLIKDWIVRFTNNY